MFDAASAFAGSSAVQGCSPSPNSMDSSEMSFRNRTNDQPPAAADGWLKRRVNQALWRAFPEATSENDLSELAAPSFRNIATGEPIEPRTIRLWLRGVSIPRGEHLLALIWMVGPDFFRLDRGAR